MSNIEKHTTGSQLEIADDQTFFTDIQLSTLKQIGMDGAGNGDLGVFFHQVQRTGLDPFAKQIYMINRQGKWTIQTGIDGFRLIARRATDAARGSFGYEDTQWADENGVWHDLWISQEPPAAARVTVVRDGSRFPAIAMFHEYAGKKRDGSLNMMWASKGAHMIAKCAEALALRKAFPQDLSGIYTSDEMGQADNPQRVTATRQQPAQQPQQAPQGAAERLAGALGARPVDDDPVEVWAARIAEAGTVDELMDMYRAASTNPAWSSEIKPLFSERRAQIEQPQEQAVDPVVEAEPVDPVIPIEGDWVETPAQTSVDA